MVKCIKVETKKINETKNKLIKESLLDRNYKFLKADNFVYIPVIKKFKNYKLFNKNLEKVNKKNLGLHELLEKVVNKKHLDHLRASLEIIGEVAILELGAALMDKKEIIGDAVLRSNENLKSVLLKKGGRKGTFRIQEYEHLSGLYDYETTHIESGIKIKLDPTKTYFTSRLATERLRIAKQVKPNENILVMFSGVGIYPFVIAKYSKPKSILAVEINPDAHYYAEESLKLNKFKNIELRCGDVREEHIHGSFDRVIMPLPESSLDFLECGLKLVKKNGIIHIYVFSNENKIDEVVKNIKSIVKCNVLDIVKAGQKAPKVYRYCLDLKILE